ncbi:hypothetical protein B484DRAFT_182535 [Ochromonadaceae sp. CCMP2298]|nr:hypothetical protein B484DRAFT_182535 [Ochromonadaceae sp. CCMP2298]
MGDNPIRSALMASNVGAFGALVADSMVVGQQQQWWVQGSFRTVSQRWVGAGTVSAPSTAYERMGQTPSSSVSIGYTASTSASTASGSGSSTSASTPTTPDTNTDTERDEYSLNMVVTSAASYGSAGALFNANPVQLQLSRLSLKPTTLSLNLVHNVPQRYPQEGFNTTCLRADKTAYNYTCASGDLLVHNCSGLSGFLTSYCPVLTPQCNVYNASEGTFSDTSCTLLRFDAHSTTCECTISPPITGTIITGTTTDRRLSEVRQSGILDVVSISEYVGSELLSTFNAYDDINSLQDVKRALIVIIMFASLWAGGLLLLFGCTWRRSHMKQWNLKADLQLDRKMRSAQISRSTAAVHQVANSVYKPSYCYFFCPIMRINPPIHMNHAYEPSSFYIYPPPHTRTHSQ